MELIIVIIVVIILVIIHIMVFFCFFFSYYVLLSSCYVSVCVLPHLRCMILFKPQPIIMNTILQMD